ncbi:YaiI/YqxD family protein [Amantichitinum ursilacus]|uniref:UPF0178 protein WG78_03845 n=1 Tax=Amantichitinum ursilacus TaxID=857265 RepID=A0A0N1JTP2_9NEIS|nr:YaiI/YqxD family protein [Amantichitinum ursilacus]KPC54674.1 hypothetical protein WG78_03845 [Amantichitinum ursilacus]
MTAITPNPQTAPPSPTIWVDADACPRPVKEMLFRAAQRTQTLTILVANQLLSVPASPFLRALQVPGGFDVADAEIVARVAPGDLVITADIPLSAQAIEKGAVVIDPRGERLSLANIGERLNMRDFMQGLRDSGVATGGPAALSAADKQAFGRELDRWLAAKARGIPLPARNP